MPETQYPPLVRAADVMKALGIEGDDINRLPVSMRVRMEPTINRVSRRFRIEAQRIFTPGSYTQERDIHAGYSRLMEPPTRIERVRVLGRQMIDWTAWQEGGPEWVVWAEGGPVEDFGTTGQLTVLGFNEPPPRKWRPMPRYEVNGIWLHWSDWDFWQLNGKKVEITYSWAQPQDMESMKDSVSNIVAKNLVVDPLSAVRQSKMLSSRHFRQEVNAWVNSGSYDFDANDIKEAQSYRYPIPPHIIAHMTMIDASPSQAFMSDTSW
jgi:hypothetical protein